jgi:energy-coupling factor transporter transmembrane protein EcfT
MKKLMMFFALMFVLILPTFGQAVNPPTNWLELFANINVWLASLAGVAAVTVFLAAFLNTLLKTQGFVKQLVAWIISILLLVVGNLLNMGFMAELTWLNTIAYGIAAGFIANGIFDIETVKAILRALKIEKEV